MTTKEHKSLKEKRCRSCTVAFHIGHSTYTKRKYLEAKKTDDLDCCGGTIKLNYCPFCGIKIDWKETEVKGE